LPMATSCLKQSSRRLLYCMFKRAQYICELLLLNFALRLDPLKII
jgi:hypothetical protein